MHPTLVRYLNFGAAVDTLRREDLGQVLDAGERPLAAAARAFQDERALLLSTRGQGPPPPEAQQALVVLAAHAAAAALEEDEGLRPALEEARAALVAEGATGEEVAGFIASLVLEEAFGGDEDPDTFDRASFQETLQGVPALAQLTRNRVEELIDGFTRGAAEDWRPAYRFVASELVEAAWGEGPMPINPEHLEQALEGVRERLGGEGTARGVEALRRFVARLHEAGLVGPRRLARLNAVLDLATGEPGAVGRRNPPD